MRERKNRYESFCFGEADEPKAGICFIYTSAMHLLLCFFFFFPSNKCMRKIRNFG